MTKALQIKDFPNYYITESGDIYSRNYHRSGKIKKMSLANAGGFQWRYKER